MVLSLSEVIELKQKVQQLFNADIHFHDACGGQSFSLDRADSALQEFITHYCCEKGLNVIFSEDHLQFYIK